MKRINGYIDLENYFFEDNYNSDEINTILPSIKNNYLRFQFEMDDKLVLFKKVDGLEFNELLVEEICKYLDIPSAHYDLATYKGVDGVISVSFKKDDYNYIDGYKIVKEYYDYLYDTNQLELLGIDYYKENDASKRTINKDGFISLDEYPDFMNNLEVIWASLDYRYRDYQDKDIRVANIMDGLLKKKYLDFILKQRDSHFHNWMIEENVRDSSLVPLYDNSLILSFKNRDEYNKLPTSYREDWELPSMYEDLKDFLRISDTSQIDDFIELFNKLDIEAFDLCFKRVVDRTGYVPSVDYKNKLYNNFERHRNKLSSIINEYYKSLSR